MTNLRACVFGANGGIGAALVRRLAEQHDNATIYAGSRSGTVRERMNIRPFRFDLENEESIAAATESMGRAGPLDLVIVTTGMLHTEQAGPEKTWRSLNADDMAQAFAINTIGPALIAKHALPLLNRESRSVFAALSARVGSISDNRLGGWHSYRASKAALNMLVRNFAIELGRTNTQAVAVALHPGTVDTALSEPFQANLPEGQLLTPETSAERLMAVIDGLAPADSGAIFDWKGKRIEP